MRLWIFILLIGCLSSLLTYLYIFIAIKFSIFDHPNQRSSHSIITPRGGGIAIVISYFVGLLTIYNKDVVQEPIFLALLSGGLAVSIIGFIDDKFGLSARLRIIIQFIAATFALWCLGDVPQLPFGILESHFKPLGYLLATLLILWSTNLFNFMDGINGLAALESIFVTLGGALILILVGETMHAASLLLIATSSLGFLVFNFPKAKVFMGDSGSLFLGFMIAVYAIGLSNEDIISPWTWVILYGYFIIDSSYTLMVRIVTNQQIFSAHHLHAYQTWARRSESHAKVTTRVMLINLCWLLPWAITATVYHQYSMLFCFISLLPLISFVFLMKAGNTNKND